ncbi:putative ribonuclease H-like domain-containing protein, partial [Tanacetum coccineum]
RNVGLSEEENINFQIPSIKQSQSCSLVQSSRRLKRDRATLSVNENGTKTLMSLGLAFLSSEYTGSTNEVSTASGDFRVSTAGGINQMDGDDLEELDLRWQVAMLTVRVKKFIQRTGRNMDFKEKRHVSLDKSRIECYNCHRKGHFARECRSGRNQGRRSYGDNVRSNAPTTESSSQALVAQDGLGSYEWSNNFKVEPVTYALMEISSSRSSSSFDSEVQKCSKQCLDSFKTLQKNYDTEREKHNKTKLEIRGYEIALESLESRILGYEKNELAWGKKYEFQNYELKCREIKINNLNLELEKVVKERDELKDKIAKWEESSKNLDEILNSQMSARDKTSLSKADGYKAVPPPITGNFLTPRADISFAGLDEYAIRNKIIESQTTELNTKTSETAGKTNDANTEKPKSVSESVVSNPKINRDSVIIEDWNSDDEEEGYEVQTVRPETQTVKTSGQNSKKQGIGFKKVKACFVCKSTDHLIKDCNFHDKKSQEPKLKNVVNTGQREGKPVWDNTKRVNHQNFSKYPHLSKTFVPSGVLTRTGLHRPSVSTARPVCTARPSVSTARPVCTARPSVSTARPVYATRPIYPRMDNVRPRGSCSPIKRSYYTKPAFRPKDLKQDVKTFGVQNMTTAGTRAVVNTGKGKLDTDLKKSRWVWRPKGNYLDHVSKDSGSFMLKKGNPEILLQDHAVVDSGCSSHMTGNKAYLSDYEDFNGGFVAFGSDPKGDELKFNLFSVSQMCDKKNSVLFTESECLILSPSFKLLDESQVVLRAPRKDDVYSLDLKNIVPSGGHLVRGLPLKVFVNDHTCVACKKGKQHKASCKAKLERIIRKPLELLHMDLFGPVSVESINKKRYCLVVTDDFSRFSWVFFLATKDETSEILCNLIIGLEKQLNHNVKIIRCDNGTEFKNYAINEFCAKKGIKREFSVARTPQQNGVAERKNRTLIEAARTMLADRKYPLSKDACQVMLKMKLLDRTMDEVYSLGKFDGKSDEGYLLGYSIYSLRIHTASTTTSYDKEGQHQMIEDEQVLHDDLEKMIAQEVVATALDDATRQAFEEEKRNIASQKRAAQTTSITKVSTGRSSISTVTTPYVSAASISIGTNAGEIHLVYLEEKNTY